MANTFITIGANDKFQDLRGIDLQDLLLETNNYLLEYRNRLELPPHVTFGVELEYEGIRIKKTDRFIERKLSNWYSEEDGSLINGGEIVSPVMKDEEKYWQELLKVCKFLTKNRADTLHNAGGHVHVGSNILQDEVDAWRKFLKLYTLYEDVLFRFMYGDKISARKRILDFACPVAGELHHRLDALNKANSMSDIISELPRESRYIALNFKNVKLGSLLAIDDKNTLEYRAPNATCDPIVCQNNINAFTKMGLAPSKNLLDEDLLDYKIKNYTQYLGNEFMYNEINLRKVLEFVDMIFDNNLDKVYFLRQYLKDFQEGYKFESAIRSKRFTVWR